MHRGERFAWILLGAITAALVLMAAAIFSYEYLGARRIAECREELSPGTESWDICGDSGDWHN